MMKISHVATERHGQKIKMIERATRIWIYDRYAVSVDTRTCKISCEVVVGAVEDTNHESTWSVSVMVSED